MLMSPNAPQIDIVLATYNGAAYLSQQLESLLDQSHQNWHLYARDDGSRDDSRNILKSFQRAYPERVTLLDDELGPLGIVGNFQRLLQASQAPYVALCDQDDVWLPHKLTHSLATLRETEKETGAQWPLLVHSDLQVVDAKLKPLAESFWAYQHLDASRGWSLNRLLVQNVVTGCTVLMNRALLNKALPLPAGVLMHDWWLALVAASFGQVIALPEAGLQYRQHGRNGVGAQAWTPKLWLNKALAANRMRQALRNTQAQADLLLQAYAGELSLAQRDMLSAYAQLSTIPAWRRRYLLHKYGFFKTGLLRNLGMYLLV